MDATAKTKTLKDLSIGCSDDPCCPTAGAVFVCEECGCTVAFLKDCKCGDMECVCLCCCGKPMTSAN